jgi:hypothetical protein
MAKRCFERAPIVQFRHERRGDLAMALSRNGSAFLVSFPAVFLSLCGVTLCSAKQTAAAEPVLRAGAAAIEINPTKYPVHVNGMHPDRTTSTLLDDLYTRALVLDNGKERIAVVVVDSNMLPRDLLDRAKALANTKTGISVDHVLISATHTHSAPAAMANLGTPRDDDYARMLPDKIAQSIILATSHLEPARVGWAVVEDAARTHTRRAIRRSDKMGVNPWGEATDRASDPGFSPLEVTGPAGPSDPDLSLLSVQAATGRPIALLANYGNHYYGVPELANHSPLLSADYFGIFARMIRQLVQTDGAYTFGTPATNTKYPPFVGIMSQGTSGDQIWNDFSQPPPPPAIEVYSDAIAREAYEAYRTIEYHTWVPLKMAETKLTLRFRAPDTARLAWAHKIIADAHRRIPSNVGYGEEYAAAMPYAYAVQQIYLAQHPNDELKLQAVRIGDLGITAIPAEVYALTGLKLKAQSPLQPTINITLANGADGYIPPPEQHALGSYTTWAASTAGLEVQAEPKIVDAVLGLLEEVAGQSRRPIAEPNGAYTQSVLASNPLAYWRLDEMSGPLARDASGHDHTAHYEPGIAFYLTGPESAAFSGEHVTNHAIHFAGGCIHATLPAAGSQYTVEFWVWNGFPYDVREMTGWLFSHGSPKGAPWSGDALGLDGTAHLVLTSGKGGQASRGTAMIALRGWTHIALVHDGTHVDVYVNGNSLPDISTSAGSLGATSDDWYFGGRSEGGPGLEGKMDEAAVYNRALSPLELSDHFRMSGMSTR